MAAKIVQELSSRWNTGVHRIISIADAVIVSASRSPPGQLRRVAVCVCLNGGNFGVPGSNFGGPEAHFGAPEPDFGAVGAHFQDVTESFLKLEVVSRPR